MPNMFKCTLASGGALILTVTTDSTFAGQTITCTDGTTTLTQVFPTVSPYSVKFKIPNSGIWTISSGTVSGILTIPDSIEFHDIPTGSTITPTDDVQIWLHCANIWNKTYTTISQVLNDSTTVTALIASTNAVDYMARSTTWASSVCANSSAMTKIGANNYCADALLADSTWRTAICNSTYFERVLNVKVPTMTSNTSPSGTASASNVYSDYYAYKAFDNNSSTKWMANGRAQEWVAYEFTNNVKIYKAIFNGGGGYDYNSIIQSSDDGVTWRNESPSVSGVIYDYTFLIDSPHSCKRWRMTSGQQGLNTFSVNSLQFYGRA